MTMDDEHPFDLVIAALRAHGMRPVIKGNTARSSCPCHDDKTPSLSITRCFDKALMHCFAGCVTRAILRAIGLRERDLFVSGPNRAGIQRTTTRVVARYPYENAGGDVIARKVRLDPKRFFWEIPTPASPSSWRPGLGGVAPSLYKLSQLRGATRVIVVEGEKAVDRLASYGLVATCASAGASLYKSEYAVMIRQRGCCEVIVLPDNDPAGLEHGARVAQSCYALTDCRADERPDDRRGAHTDAPPTQSLSVLRVKMIRIPDLPRGGDVVDWLDGGHTIHELNRLIESAPCWHPRAEEEERIARRRRQTRDRVRRFRQQRKNGGDVS